ncbi:RraA family protein [Salinarimonas rosea]|uniref:RraA family protein n=1 Tax=Salinarimonas rosea TaxID=552063 RepID=UPI00048BACBD|nr:RraA family protein [Salinarimonas rosea]
MTLGFRIIRDRPRPPEEVLAASGRVPVANISDNMHRIFAGGPQLRPFHRSGRLCGVALTVRTRPGDNAIVHKALDLAQAGDVLVADVGGDLTNAIIGEIMLAYARMRSVAGFVIHGSVRDIAAIAEDGLPVYTRGATHRGHYKHGPGEINVPVSVGGMVVVPGDILVGDEDGVLAVPLDQAEEILALTSAQQEREAGILCIIAEATWDRAWIDQALQDKGCEV